MHVTHATLRLASGEVGVGASLCGSREGSLGGVERCEYAGFVHAPGSDINSHMSADSVDAEQVT